MPKSEKESKCKASRQAAATAVWLLLAVVALAAKVRL
jgi:hypothetical protein